jgi:membrane-associated phospholipid phosphatase
MKLKIIFIFISLIVTENFSVAASFSPNELFKINISTEIPDFKRIEFNQNSRNSYSSSLGGGCGEALHNDSIHRINFRYKDRKRGIKPFIAPTLLIATGTALHFSTEAKENFQDWIQEKTNYTGHVEDYLQYVPGVAVYALNAFGVKGKNNFGNRTAIVIKSLLINELIVSHLKTGVNEERPNGGDHSFPSGHTSVAFALAQFMHHEFGDRSVWYSIGAYSSATTVGVLRVAGNAHWISDVVAGAGFGMLSTELVYLTHQYKWDNEHIKNFDIFPWRTKRQSGLTMVYTF